MRSRAGMAGDPAACRREDVTSPVPRRGGRSAWGLPLDPGAARDHGAERDHRELHGHALPRRGRAVVAPTEQPRQGPPHDRSERAVSPLVVGEHVDRLGDVEPAVVGGERPPPDGHLGHPVGLEVAQPVGIRAEAADDDELRELRAYRRTSSTVAWRRPVRRQRGPAGGTGGRAASPDRGGRARSGRRKIHRSRGEGPGGCGTADLPTVSFPPLSRSRRRRPTPWRPMADALASSRWRRSPSARAPRPRRRWRRHNHRGAVPVVTTAAPSRPPPCHWPVGGFNQTGR